jgi:hypothetical protein
MGTDRSIQDAIQAGQRNAEGIELVKNWCAHVRIDRMGGRGMVEAMTGLPIGHHGLACDHAPAGGIMSWDTRDAALYFYDRNCKACTLRKPVGIPNISKWVGERDRALAEAQAREELANQQREERWAARQADRKMLRSGLSPAAADIVDQIEELDGRGASDLSSRLVETANLAPDAFIPGIIEHMFCLLEARERWFDAPGLATLAALDVQPERLARCAMLALREWNATDIAVRVLSGRLPQADVSLIPGILPALIELASPNRDLIGHHPRPRPAPLVLLDAKHPKAVIAALDALLSRGPAEIGLAARAITVLGRRDTALLQHFSRDLISKLVRARWMPDPEDHGHRIEDSAAADLRDAVVTAFSHIPEQVDGLLKSFRLGASEAGEVRIASIYGRVLHHGRFRSNRPISEADRLAFRRLLWEAPETKNDRVLDEILSNIHDDPRDLVELAREEVDHLLGAAILMDGRVSAFDAEPVPEKGTMLDRLDRENRRRNLSGLRNSFISWAAAGAAARDAPGAYLGVLTNLPENQDPLAARMIEHSVALIETAEGLNAVLPTLYSAIVGVSVLRRGAACRALAEMPHRQRANVPDLLFEAFLAALTDPYVHVHTSAVMALGRFRPPEKLRGRVRKGLWAVLSAHCENQNQKGLVLECIEQLSKLLTDKEKSETPGAFLVSLLAKMPAWHISNSIQWILREVARAEGVVPLLIQMITDPESSDHCEENALQTLGDLPNDVVYAHRAEIAAIPVGQDRGGWFPMLDLVELLTRSCAWNEAEELAAGIVAVIPQTVRETPVRLTFELAHAAAAFENALAQGDKDRAAKMAMRWRETKTAKEANERAIAKLPDPFGDLR